MARTTAVLSQGSRITDYISLGVITRALPPEKVNSILETQIRGFLGRRVQCGYCSRLTGGSCRVPACQAGLWEGFLVSYVCFVTSAPPFGASLSVCPTSPSVSRCLLQAAGGLSAMARW